MPTQKLLTTAQLAELLQTSTGAVPSKVFRGEIPGVAIVRRTPKGKMLFKVGALSRVYPGIQGYPFRAPRSSRCSLVRLAPGNVKQAHAGPLPHPR